MAISIFQTLIVNRIYSLLLTPFRFHERRFTPMTSPSFTLFLRLLGLAALLDWLLTRTLTRLAIFIPKTPAMISGYEILSFVGQVGSSLAGLLVLTGLGWIICYEWRRGSRWLPLVLATQIGLSLLFLVVIPFGWSAVARHVLTLAAIFLLAHPILKSRSQSGQLPRQKMLLLLPVLALSLGEFFHLSPALYSLLRWSGPPAFSLTLFNLGEFFAVFTPIALWWVWGRGAPRRAWIVGSIPAILFGVLYLATPAMTGTIVIWSTGMTLYLPWPLYTLSLWLAGVTILAASGRSGAAGWAILLLAAGGYAPQFSVQIFLSLIGLWLLIWTAEVPVPEPFKLNEHREREILTTTNEVIA
jgi:hypothetical protein